MSCSKHDDSCFHNNFNLRAGLVLVSEVGLLSFVLASSLLFYSLRQAYKNYRGRDSTPNSSAEPWIQPISVLFLCAIFIDVIGGVGNILSVRWAFTGEVVEGPYCTAQAALKQIGGNGVAWFTMAIAILTYLQVVHWSWVGERGAKIFATGSICFITVFIILIIAIPASIFHPYYGEAGPWCWIRNGSGASRQKLRFTTQYASEWLAILVSIVAYGAVAYKWLHQASIDANYDLKRDAIAMGWYPIAYCVVVAPLSAVRFRQFSGHQSTTAGEIFPSALIASWGAINAILWYSTGRRFGFSNKESTSPSSTSNLKLGSPEEFEMIAQAAPIDGGAIETIPIPPTYAEPPRSNTHYG
ncbi:uncharacterized protein EI90DRAFT_3080787 [Cantharellus anzutake]|uniref:uncharacterized protein n=1 Tax=Cantharellus anzutake TaxID=1750568 RepID=UPI001905DBCF|nr:uncharacterized protein EI90DRAFT_3080787 [Cantharellus anzutake]KAF8320617.1 hypothetical protein EI90DRAFT_3080787 [Cantharellus anzutake]